MVPLIGDLYETYSRSSKVVKDDYDELKNLWKKILLLKKDIEKDKPEFITPVTTHDSGRRFVETCAKTGSETGENVFSSTEKVSKRNTYTRGMSDDLYEASRAEFNLASIILTGENRKKKNMYTTMDMVYASMFGGPAQGGDPKPDPKWGRKRKELYT